MTLSSTSTKGQSVWVRFSDGINLAESTVMYEYTKPHFCGDVSKVQKYPNERLFLNLKIFELGPREGKYSVQYISSTSISTSDDMLCLHTSVEPISFISYLLTHIKPKTSSRILILLINLLHNLRLPTPSLNLPLLQPLLKLLRYILQFLPRRCLLACHLTRRSCKIREFRGTN